MLNTVAKGSRNQLKTRKYLEEEGWIVYTVVRVKFKPDHDIFGLFDHVAWKDGIFDSFKQNQIDVQNRY
jgi:uncharacterized protein YkuJ